jgi:CRISPR-associated protein Cmr1
MNPITLDLELLTPCFAGGAQPETAVELRASSMRGQLRWWFRVLGGFASLGQRPLIDQESMVFGWGHGKRRLASPLILRVETLEKARSCQVIKNAGQTPIPSQAAQYLLPYLEHRARAAWLPPLPKFKLHAWWLGEPRLEADVRALLHVFAHVGSLGYRSRRGLGAWGHIGQPPSWSDALSRFRDPSKVLVRQMAAQDAGHAIQLLAQWLRKWRNYGRSPRMLNPFGPGLAFAKKDHDAGLNLHSGEVYRAALGLPIHQRYQQGKSVDWSCSRLGQAAHETHFASPILLRPYRLASSKWLALVLFIDARQWPDGKKAFLNGQPRSVSRALYEAMKKDSALQPASF